MLKPPPPSVQSLGIEQQKLLTIRRHDLYFFDIIMNKEKSVSMWKEIVKLSQLCRMAWFITKSAFAMTLCAAQVTYSIIGNETCHFKMTSCQCCVS